MRFAKTLRPATGDATSREGTDSRSGSSPFRLQTLDRKLIRELFGSWVAFVAIATVVAAILRRRATSESARATVDNLVARTRAWWVMVFVFGIAIATGGIGSLVMFAIVSFLALREFMTLLPTRRADHRAMLWTFFLFLPLLATTTTTSSSSRNSSGFILSSCWLLAAVKPP